MPDVVRMMLDADVAKPFDAMQHEFSNALIFSHPTGNANVREALTAFAAYGYLGEFWTTVAWNPEGWLNSLLPNSLRCELSRRAFPAPARAVTHTWPWREIARHIVKRTPLRRLSYPGHTLSPNAVHEGLDQVVAKRLTRDLKSSLRGVYAYDHAALATFQEAKRHGLACIYDLPVPHWRTLKRLCDEEIELYPDWHFAHPFRDLTQEELDRKDEELRQADVVIVASEFSKRSLTEAPSFAAPVIVVPYGAPPLVSCAAGETRHSGRLRVLFVGGLEVGKGLHYLIEAMYPLSKVAELTVIGQPHGQLAPMLANAMNVHRWIPSLPHGELLREMGRNDVLVLPSLYDGFALVVTEALSRGLPVITTANTGAAELLEDGKDGFVVPIRSSEAIAEKLALIATDRELLTFMSLSASRKAQSLDWQAYRERLASVVASTLGI